MYLPFFKDIRSLWPKDFSTLTPSLSTALLCLCSDHLLALSKPKLSSTKTKRRASPTTKAELWSVFHILWPFTLRSAWRWSYKKRTGDQWETGFKIIKTRHLCSLSLLFVSASFSSIQSKQTMAFVIFMTQWRSCPTLPHENILRKIIQLVHLNLHRHKRTCIFGGSAQDCLC